MRQDSKRTATAQQAELEIPLIIEGKAVKSGNLAPCIIPHDHAHQLAVFHQAGEKEVALAIEAAAAAAAKWADMDW